MSMTTTVRFLDPIDPRVVWKRMVELFWPGDPAEFNAPHHSAGELWFLEFVHTSSGWNAAPGQGALALIHCEYGPEGSLLPVEHFCVDGEECTCEQDHPRAYVECSYDQPYSVARTDQHDAWFIELAKLAAPDRVAWMRGEYDGNWHVLPEMLLPREPAGRR